MPTMTELIKQFHEERATIGMARTTLRGFHMPTTKMMQHLRRKCKVQAPVLYHCSIRDKELAMLEKQVRPVAAAYCDLFNTPDIFPTLHSKRDLEFALDVMEAFVW